MIRQRPWLTGLDLTESLLAGVQSADLVRTGAIADVQNHRVQLLGEQH